jgi:hypothetical protein
MAKQPTKEELQAVSRGLNKPKPRPIVAGSFDADQMTHKRPGPPSDPLPVAPVAPVAQAAPVVEEAPPPNRRTAGGPGPSKGKQAPGPAPAAVAASRGVAPSAPVDVSRETPQEVPPELDLPAFHYREQVEAMERKAMEQGRPEEAARLRGHYNQLIDGQFRHIESEYKAKTLPQVQAIQAELLKFQGKQLPRELAMKAREAVMQAGQQQQQMLGYLYGLTRNEATKGLGIKYFNESELLEPGVQLADLVVDEKTGMLIGVDASGATVKMSSGQEFAFPIDAAEQLYKDLYESDKDDSTKLGEGDKLVDRKTGREIASNPKGQYASTDERLSAIKVGTGALARRLGIELDATGRLMEGVDEGTRQKWLELSAEVERAILKGTPPQQAADEVWRNASAGSAPAAAPAAGYNGPRPWAP